MRRASLAALAALAGVGAVLAVAVPRSGSDSGGGPQNRVLARALALARGEASRGRFDPRLSGGTLNAALDAQPRSAPVSAARRGGGPPGRAPGDLRPLSRPGTQGCSNVFRGRGRVPDNIRVNQDCTLRGQREEVVLANPRDVRNVIAGQNDARIGLNHCGFDWSFDAGRSWGDQVPPFWQELLQDGRTADICSDPGLAADADGNVYASGVFFNFMSDVYPATAILVAKSNWPNGGSFYHSPAPDPYQEYRATPLGRPGSDAGPDVLNDKPLPAADWWPSSPKRNRVYVTWTRAEANATDVGFHQPIVFSQSLDGGATWSPPVVISGSAGQYCTGGSATAGDPAACDQDQGSDPVVGPDGTIYVAFANGNTPEFGQNQVLMVACPPTRSCDSASDWTPPTRVGDLVGTHPFGPDPTTGCAPNAQCLPPNGYRVAEFASISISVDRSSNLYVAWADFRNGRAPCTPLSGAAAATPPCDNDVFYAYSLDRGTTWSPTVDVTPRSRLGETAQWQPWSDVFLDGRALRIAFYDRHYGRCEFDGCNDITLATVQSPRSPRATISYRRVTTSSMPNMLPANNPVETQTPDGTPSNFLGDYMWVDVDGADRTHVVWADTRPLPYRPAGQCAPEADIYYAQIDERDNGGRGGDDDRDAGARSGRDTCGVPPPADDDGSGN